MRDHGKKLPTHFRCGGRLLGGCDWYDAHIVFFYDWISFQMLWESWTPGLHAVILDEIGTVERNVEHRLLFEVMQAVQKRHEEWQRPFLILMCTAMVSDRLDGTLKLLSPLRVECPRRPYEVERYEVGVGSLREMWQAMATAAANLLRNVGFCFLD